MSRFPLWATVAAVGAGLFLAWTVMDGQSGPAEQRCDQVPLLTGQPPLAGFPPKSVLFGASVPTSRAGIDVEGTAAAAGRPLGAVQIFLDWTSPFPTEFVQETAPGAVPMITWQPWRVQGTVDPSLTLASIVEGDHDDYIRSWAESAAGSCRPVMLPFAPEMNGPWEGWSELSNGNQPGDFVAAWRHVHGLVVEKGATNLVWIWNPNILADGLPPFGPLYPGDAYVDWLGLAGFNWGTAVVRSRWTTFSEVFDASLAAIADISDKPVMLGEFASTEEGGSKAEWIADMFARIPERPQIRGVMWFDYEKETDWRIKSSLSAQEAFRVGIDSDTYLGEGQVPAALAAPTP